MGGALKSLHGTEKLYKGHPALYHEAPPNPTQVSEEGLDIYMKKLQNFIELFPEDAEETRKDFHAELRRKLVGLAPDNLCMLWDGSTVLRF